MKENTLNLCVNIQFLGVIGFFLCASAGYGALAGFDTPAAATINCSDVRIVLEETPYPYSYEFPDLSGRYMVMNKYIAEPALVDYISTVVGYDLGPDFEYGTMDDGQAVGLDFASLTAVIGTPGWALPHTNEKGQVTFFRTVLSQNKTTIELVLCDLYDCEATLEVVDSSATYDVFNFEAVYNMVDMNNNFIVYSRQNFKNGMTEVIRYDMQTKMKKRIMKKNMPPAGTGILEVLSEVKIDDKNVISFKRTFGDVTAPDKEIYVLFPEAADPVLLEWVSNEVPSQAATGTVFGYPAYKAGNQFVSFYMNPDPAGEKWNIYYRLYTPQAGFSTEKMVNGLEPADQVRPNFAFNRNIQKYMLGFTNWEQGAASTVSIQTYNAMQGSFLNSYTIAAPEGWENFLLKDVDNISAVTTLTQIGGNTTRVGITHCY